MKNIIHFKFNSEIHRVELVQSMLKYLRGNIGDEYLVIASPFDPSLLRVDDADPNFKNFNLDTISVDELNKLIGR